MTAVSALKPLARAVAERAGGGRPGPVRALVASAVTGTATAVITYRLLRGS